MTSTVDDVIRRMRDIAAAGPADDGLVLFTTVYLATTEAVAARLTGGFFRDPARVAEFDVVFADRYFAAVDADAAGKPTTAAWRPLFAARRRPGIHAVQFVLAGMNAHINHDLALAVVDTCARLGIEPTDQDFETDYRRITDVLVAVEARVRAELLSDVEEDLTAPLGPLLHLVGSWSLASAREAAWVQALVLWQLRDAAWLSAQLVEQSSRTTGMVGAQLLVPLAG